uniref:Formylglycine-generating enzyme, required for sulfatase activity, contains SUMF1/FGE domain n=1 Tax=Candidatus Kentrum sp. LFY TaxID=2126342 RepID=A0A450V1I6_9GAMM|nr:MAG: Formylglycine-generating enzyme, required for sulfatase activity, contains SUMF1/FGE domain [Candidatus Kentron sp. LFY]
MKFPATAELFPDIPFLRATSFAPPDEFLPIPRGEASERSLEDQPREDHLLEDHPLENPAALQAGTAQERCMEVCQQGGELTFRIQAPDSDASLSGSPLARVSSVDGFIDIEAIASSEEEDPGHAGIGDITDDADGDLDTFWKTGRAPAWVSDRGIDQYGHWADFTLKGSDEAVTQRLRWIGPGHFLMGSPPREPDRYDDEGPRHKVTLPTGFWLFDTACTQDLWQAVMGNNPSRFKGEDRPIEQVSWNDVQKFLDRINSRIPGLELVLPSEAEWEYGCRAGTDSPFGFGENITPEQVNYNGEYPYTGGEIGEYRKCTVPVASLPPNPWGLYEMHGNVWEWTRDCWHENYRETSDDASSNDTSEASSESQPGADLDTALDADPDTHSHVGTDISNASNISDVGRVVRGGSWRNVARVVRSAVRDRNKPGEHSNNLGFRCARIESDDQPAGVQSMEAEEEQRNAVEQLPSPASAGTSDKTRIRIEETTNCVHCPTPLGKAFSIRTDQGQFAFETETKPQWASAIGRDRFGLWTEISLDTTSGSPNPSVSAPVTQRLRWIPPGRFIMGSPESEWETFPRYDRERWCNQEGPQHQVILTRGYWLFDTPCTQALWEAIMGNNPSRFPSPARPVESINWQEANEFMERINKRIPGLDLVLPSEAQWEYACRAGTEAATYAGPMEILGSNNTEILDSIAWYGGNSGVAFELENGYDSSDWREKQYDHARAGTHPVGEKAPNPWGLHDMLGNIWEWCRDGQRDYHEGIVTDPMGPMALGVSRIVRGGSWYYFARYVRSASRFRYQPTVRLDRLGFRCARM